MIYDFFIDLETPYTACEYLDLLKVHWKVIHQIHYSGCHCERRKWD